METTNHPTHSFSPSSVPDYCSRLPYNLFLSPVTLSPRRLLLPLVVWKNAVESLSSANLYIATVEQARIFAETYMKHIIGILVEQQPSKIGQHERTCVEESLELAIIIIAKDLKIQQTRFGECSLLDVLALVFNRKKSYYKGSKGWNVNHLSGLPEVRLRMIEVFRAQGGFAALAEYLETRIRTPLFPPLELLHQILNQLL